MSGEVAPFADSDAWRLTIHRYEGGWSWSTAPEGAPWEISGWTWTRRGALRSMRGARRRDERTHTSRESWTEPRPTTPEVGTP